MKYLFALIFFGWEGFWCLVIVMWLFGCTTGYKIVNGQGECLYWVDYDRHGKKEILPCPSRHEWDRK